MSYSEFLQTRKQLKVTESFMICLLVRYFRVTPVGFTSPCHFTNLLRCSKLLFARNILDAINSILIVSLKCIKKAIAFNQIFKKSPERFKETADLMQPNWRKHFSLTLRKTHIVHNCDEIIDLLACFYTLLIGSSHRL